MISENIVKALTRQINREIYSAYFYLGMASYAESKGFKGVSNWFKVQAREELEHARKMYDYLNQQGARVMMQAIEEPPQDFLSVVELFVKTLEHEKKVTRLINDIVTLAKNENDQDMVKFLQWFVKEQVEEEANPANILKNIDTKGSDKKGLSDIDAQLAKRR